MWCHKWPWSLAVAPLTCSCVRNLNLNFSDPSHRTDLKPAERINMGGVGVDRRTQLKELTKGRWWVTCLHILSPLCFHPVNHQLPREPELIAWVSSYGQTWPQWAEKVGAVTVVVVMVRRIRYTARYREVKCLLRTSGLFCPWVAWVMIVSLVHKLLTRSFINMKSFFSQAIYSLPRSLSSQKVTREFSKSNSIPLSSPNYLNVLFWRIYRATSSSKKSSISLARQPISLIVTQPETFI